MSRVTILPAWRASHRDGASPVRAGWNLIVDGEWSQTFSTKREARDAAIGIVGMSPLVRRAFLDNDHHDLSVACRASGLPHTGTKEALAERLYDAGVPALKVGTRQMSALYSSVIGAGGAEGGGR